ncbi:calcium-binding protein [Alisedimentitalea sp. MJ-SS2]|uniref:calcium-binding protein n=1 Tax=Aliisedimentitalea sp. MJ-SS2 TaxID=3049795 RepID=UPI00290983A3|nr:calcium-binding protein [Alisedimentitalea sp. MJ-SS2]MDU8926219.1 calcium-binding protein [Alisedimentitalea sp. MJ-SS2]
MGKRLSTLLAVWLIGVLAGKYAVADMRAPRFVENAPTPHVRAGGEMMVSRWIAGRTKTAPVGTVTKIAASSPEPAPDKPETTAPSSGAGLAVGLADPSLAMGLNGIADWSTQQPFIDIMKTARPWLGHEAANWGAWNAERLQAGGFLDEHGWVRALPPGVDRVESFLLTDQDKRATAMQGRYRVRWQGEGKLRIGGRARNRRYGENEAWFDYSPNDGEVVLTLSKVAGDGNHIRDIEIIREDHIVLHDLGVVFNPGWIERIADLRMVRFMDWMLTNGSPVTSWNERPEIRDFSYVWRGVPAEVMIDLANLIGADPWFCMPHAADDAYVTRFAEMVRDRLDPRLKAHVEYSNEVWNFIFPQSHWAAEKARARWGDAADGDGWMQYAGLRGAEVMQLWSEVFGDFAAARLVRVAAVQTGWMGLEEPFLEAPLWQKEKGGEAPVRYFDAYAVSGYFGFETENDESGRLPELRQWMDMSREAAETEARASGLQRRALEAAVEPVQFDQAVPLAARALKEGALEELSDVFWPYHARVARRHGLQLIMYEGGSHIVAHGSAVEDEDLSAFFAVLSYSREVGELYTVLLERWAALEAGPFNAFVDVARSSRHGSWGALRHLQDDNPRWAALMARNAVPLRGAATRDAGTFLHGVLRQGGGTVEGTVEEDILVGGPGDDLLISHGGADYMDGGEGRDIARLVGSRDDYSFAMEGGRLLAAGPGGDVRMRGVELLEFAANPGRQYRLDLPE